VFTARYGLSPYITQIRFVFRRLSVEILLQGTIHLRVFVIVYFNRPVRINTSVGYSTVLQNRLSCLSDM
jgi:hypothetical protein